MIILGVETSCDETAIAVIKASKNKIEVLANVVSSQVELHAKWGGVVPNLAAREHLKNIIPVFKDALDEASLKKENIDLVSVTQGPGLMPALLVGTNFAKTISYLWKKPLLGIHHIEGHIYANFIKTKKVDNEFDIKFPVLALVVSGGHTQLIFMKDHLQYEIVGETQDDAVGEAFDKVARILGLGYPGGPVISQLAEKWKLQKSNVKSYGLKLPRPMLNSSNFNFSFSGLKTAVLYAVKKYREENKLKEEDSLPKYFVAEVAYEFQEATIEVFVKKTIKVAKEYKPKTIIMAGGVSANIELNKQIKEAVRSVKFNGVEKVIYISPNTRYSLDNATMIAVAGYYRWKNMSKKEKKNFLYNWEALQADAGLRLTNLSNNAKI